MDPVEIEVFADCSPPRSAFFVLIFVVVAHVTSEGPRSLVSTDTPVSTNKKTQVMNEEGNDRGVAVTELHILASSQNGSSRQSHRFFAQPI